MIRQLTCLPVIAVMLLSIGCSSTVRHLSALSDQDVEKRRNAAFQLSAGDQLKEKDVQQLIEASFDKDATVREFAIKAVGKMDPRWEGVPQTIRRGLQDPDINVRRAAAAIFSTMTPVPSEILFTLALSLGDEDSLLRDFAKSTFVDLGQIGVNALVRTCKSGNDTLCCHAASTLGTIGCEAKRALPALKDLLKSENDDVRTTAEKSIKKIEYSYYCASKENSRP